MTLFSLRAPWGSRAITDEIQFQLWTGITPLYADARAAVLGSESS